jgi:hypothetical protein
MIVKGIAKKYMGAISSELKAARLYDKYALIIQGFQVTTCNDDSFRRKQTFLIRSRNFLICWKKKMKFRMNNLMQTE